MKQHKIKLDVFERTHLSILESLVRKIYHDGMNLCGPLKEMVFLDIEEEVARYVTTNMGYYMSLLKNLRTFYLFKTRKELFPVEEFDLSRLIEEISVDPCFLGKEHTINLEKEILVRTRKDLLYVVVLNLVNNSYRFGEETVIRIDSNNLIIKNSFPSPGKEDIHSIYELPVLPDKYGIVGAGVGLKIVRELTQFLSIDLFSKIDKTEVLVWLHMGKIRI